MKTTMNKLQYLRAEVERACRHLDARGRPLCAAPGVRAAQMLEMRRSADLRDRPYEVGTRAGHRDGYVVDATAGVILRHGPARQGRYGPFGLAITDATADCQRMLAEFRRHQ